SVTSARVLQGVAYFRLGKVTARQASQLTAGRGRRAGKCNEARRWFEQSTPILDAAEREGQWQPDEGPRATQMEQHLSVCGPPRTAQNTV
ncbi:hypothetical protein ABTM95_19220, partial [Acinetobacter baumannii]